MSLHRGITYHGIDSLTTPSRFLKMEESEDGETDSSSPGNTTSEGSPSLRQALSGEDAIESPPLRQRVPPTNKPLRRKQVSSPSDLDEEEEAGTSTPSPSSPSLSTSDDKPPQSYIALISMAILQHPEKKMLLGDIYQFIMDKFPHYRNAPDKAWRNSIRHNLSINECFIKVGRADNGKGNFWGIHPACEEDFGKGDFRRRQARRRARRSQQVNISKMPLTYRYSLGYVPMKSTPTAGGAGGGAAGASYGSSPPTRSHPYGGRPAVPYYSQTHAYPHPNPGMSPLLPHQSLYTHHQTTTGTISPPGLTSSYPTTMLSPLRNYSSGSHTNNRVPGVLSSTPSPTSSSSPASSSLGASPYLGVGISRPSQSPMEVLQGMYTTIHTTNTNSSSSVLTSMAYGFPHHSSTSPGASPPGIIHDPLTSCVYQATGGGSHYVGGAVGGGGSHHYPTSSPASSPPGGETIDNTSALYSSHSSSSPLSPGGVGSIGNTAYGNNVNDTSPTGGFSLYNASPLTNYSQLSYCDMPALRDAINGLTNLSS